MIHVQQGKLTYVLNALGIANALRLLIAFLITNEKLNQRLQFFVDGQRSLQNTIFLCFAWYKNICLILDWYHLIEKCKMQLSMALKGREIRNEILNELTHLLWYGLVDEAIKVVKSIGKRSVKNQKELKKLIGYFNRNKEYIPVYAVRKELGLRNSSNIGERMNGLIVSERQKHNGMSWSKAGSAALATVTVLKRNQEEQKWLNENDISFKWAA